MMEYLIAQFREDRPVIIDNHEQGRTNQVLELESGQYCVTLGGVQNFTPPEQTVFLSDTSVVKPHEVLFN